MHISPRTDAALTKLAEETAMSPLHWVLCCIEWKEGDGPDDWQVAELLDVERELLAGRGLSLRFATVAGHGVGKSALTAWIILWFVTTHPHCAGIITANTGAQLRTKTWRELRLWKKRCVFRDVLDITSRRISHLSSPETWGVDAVQWRASEPEAFAGLHAQHVLVIFDESSAIPDIIHETTEGAMTTAGAMWFKFGNGTRNSGQFRKDCSPGSRYVVRHVDARSSKMANQAEIQAWIQSYGVDSDFVRVRVRGMFPRASSIQFIGSDLVIAGRRRPLNVDRGAASVLALDVAREGDDRSVIVIKQGLDARSFKARILREQNLMQLSDITVDLARLHRVDAVVIDANGLGAGVFDRIKQIGLDCPVFDFKGSRKGSVPERWYNARTEAADMLREAFIAGLAIEDSDELEEEIGAVEYGFRGDALQLLPKAKMKKIVGFSPDWFDALAMACWCKVMRPDTSRREEREAPREYDPFTH